MFGYLLLPAFEGKGMYYDVRCLTWTRNKSKLVARVVLSCVIKPGSVHIQIAWSHAACIFFRPLSGSVRIVTIMKKKKIPINKCLSTRTIYIVLTLIALVYSSIWRSCRSRVLGSLMPRATAHGTKMFLSFVALVNSCVHTYYSCIKVRVYSKNVYFFLRVP